MQQSKSVKIGPTEKDILAEIGNMCAGNATTALAQILGKRIELELPSVEVINITKLVHFLKVDPEEPIIGIHLQIWGGARGNALMIFPKKDSALLIDLLIGPLQETPSSLTEIGISALKEVGNIVVSSYLSALSAFTGISAFPSTVTLTSGAAKALVTLAFSGIKKDDCTDTILVEACFKEKKRDLDGRFFIIFDADSIAVILKKAKSLIK
ncbi:MAG: chemotaxis protein CheC [Candidatus Omnitrophica bacterium]|nr:chemotaxis protein CheC [Candidatus Omnitrophota bacterium]